MASAISNNKIDQDKTAALVENGNFSFITNPNRNCQYDHVAGHYDDEIGRDESVMGINLMRKSLLYFHAKGTVLELAAGTGRYVTIVLQCNCSRQISLGFMDL